MNNNVPKTYQDWLKLFERIENQPMCEDDIQKISLGILPAEEFMVDKFQIHVVHTVDKMLRRSVRKFNGAMKESMEYGEFDNIQILCNRLEREMSHCYFYQKISFLEPLFMKELDASLREQIVIFWDKETKEITRLCEETKNPQLEEMLYFIKRIRYRVGAENGKL